MQKDCQIVHAHPSSRGERLAAVAAAWYEREIEIPAAWSGRRIAIRADTVNSLASVHLDGRRVGEIRSPGGELDASAACRPPAGAIGHRPPSAPTARAPVTARER